MQTNDDNKHTNSPLNNQEVDELTNIKYFGGHDYDGIKELDNPLPPWLKYLFYVTVIMSAAYLVLVLVFEDSDFIQTKEYKKEVFASIKNSEAEKTEITEVKPLTEEEILAAGEKVYTNLCQVCHGKFGEGLVGPNFTDKYWIHGGTADELKKVIVDGVLEKGMISYKSQLNEKQINNVTAYILSLQGTNPPNQRAAQGIKVE